VIARAAKHGKNCGTGRILGQAPTFAEASEGKQDKFIKAGSEKGAAFALAQFC